MIAEHDKKTIQTLAQKYGVRKVLVFGSCIAGDSVGRDIDIAVSGVAARDFFRFYADLICAIAKPVDLVDLDKDSLFTRLIQKDGIILYEQAA